MHATDYLLPNPVTYLLAIDYWNQARMKGGGQDGTVPGPIDIWGPYLFPKCI